MKNAAAVSLSTTIAPPAPMPRAALPAPWSFRALLVPSARYLAVAVMAVSFVFPPGGLGVDLCMLHAFTHLPCPGCGMSRAISAISQGHFSTAAALNPFAFVAWPAFLAMAALTLGPRSLLERATSWLERRAAGVQRGYRLLVIAFVAFGFARFVLFAVLQERFP